MGKAWLTPDPGPRIWMPVQRGSMSPVGDRWRRPSGTAGRSGLAIRSPWPARPRCSGMVSTIPATATGRPRQFCRSSSVPCAKPAHPSATWCGRGPFSPRTAGLVRVLDVAGIGGGGFGCHDSPSVIKASHLTLTDQSSGVRNEITPLSMKIHHHSDLRGAHGGHDISTDIKKRRPGPAGASRKSWPRCAQQCIEGKTPACQVRSVAWLLQGRFSVRVRSDGGSWEGGCR